MAPREEHSAYPRQLPRALTDGLPVVGRPVTAPNLSGSPVASGVLAPSDRGTSPGVPSTGPLPSVEEFTLHQIT